MDNGTLTVDRLDSWTCYRSNYKAVRATALLVMTGLAGLALSFWRRLFVSHCFIIESAVFQIPSALSIIA